MKCKCGKDAEPQVIDARWWLVCSEGHMDEIRLYDVFPEGQIINTPEEVICDVLKAKDIPTCFGFQSPKRYMRTVFDHCLPTDAENPNVAAWNLMKAELEKAKEYGKRLAKCAKCNYFFKCRELS